MNIAFVSLNDPSDPQTWSGIPAAILSHLVRAGANVEVIGSLSRKARYLFLPTWAVSKISKKAYQADREPFLSACYAREIERRMGRRHFDAILSLETFIISKLNRPEPVTFWVDAVWDTMVDYYYCNVPSALDTKARQQEQLAMANAVHAVYSSDWAAGAVRAKYKIDKEKLAVIPFGANLEINHNRSDVESALASRRRDSCTLLFLGVDWQRKGGAIAVETTRLLNRQGLKTRLIVAGCKVPGEKPEFVTEHGFISKRTPQGQAHLAELLRSSNFLILPTRAECAGIVFSEASAFGLPIVTTDTGGIPTYVRQGVNGIRLPLSASAETYAQNIYRLFHDRAAYEAMALAGWEEYTQKLNWSSSIRSLLSLLRQCSAPAMEPLAKSA
jgi:glycosyltransferase involved in cell wall biosynthesis